MVQSSLDDGIRRERVCKAMLCVRLTVTSGHLGREQRRSGRGADTLESANDVLGSGTVVHGVNIERTWWASRPHRRDPSKCKSGERERRWFPVSTARTTMLKWWIQC